MTNSYDVDHGLSQDEPGPLEPVELAQQPGAAPATGNTARDQEMYAAGIRTGEENTKHNAAIRAGAGWLPIESAPKDGTEILAWREDCGKFIASYTSADAFPLTQAELDAYDEATLFAKDWFTQWPDATRLDGSEVPTLWQPLPADPCPTCNDQGAVGNILTAQPCPDCAAPGVSTVEDASFPSGAIVNGRTLADRLEAYPFESQGGDLRLCSDWVEFRRCFEYLSEWVGSRAPAAGDALDAVDWYERRRELESGMIFRTASGVVQLDRPVPGDGTKWYVLAWNGDGWSAYDDTVEPVDLIGAPVANHPIAIELARAALAAQRKGDA